MYNVWLVVSMYATVYCCVLLVSLGKFFWIFFFCSGRWINGWKIKRRERKKLKSHQASAFNRRHLMFNMKFVNRPFFSFLFILYSSLVSVVVVAVLFLNISQKPKTTMFVMFLFLFVSFICCCCCLAQKKRKKIVFCNSQYFFVWFLFGEKYFFFVFFFLFLAWCSKKGESERKEDSKEIGIQTAGTECKDRVIIAMLCWCCYCC